MKKKDKYHYIFVCHGKDCCKRGASELHHRLEKEIKSAGLKSSVKVVKSKCMDRCKEGPSLVVSGSWWGKVKVKQIPKFIEDLVLLLP